MLKCPSCEEEYPKEGEVRGVRAFAGACPICDQCCSCCECCGDCENTPENCTCEVEQDYDEEYERERMDFADPGGRSALRAASEDNPRNLPCPTCGEENRLTPADCARGYQCDECADRAERGYD